jgi:uncharacterized protein YmfQ (DUF2313 family)
MADRHIRRSGSDYATQFLTLLPQGQAWPREPGSALVGACDGLSQYWGTVDARAADLLEQESDPRKTIELLPDWERAWGLPDPCFVQPFSIAERQRVLVLKMTLLGAQSRAFFEEVAGWLGYTITITEYSPFMAGISRCGDTTAEDKAAGGDGTKPRWEIGPPEMRFYWTVHVGQTRLTWFRSAAGQAGVDPHLRIGLAVDLECLLNRWKPAHTEIVFDYSGLSTGGSMEGTP